MASSWKRDDYLAKQSIVYKSAPNPKLGDIGYLRSRRILITFHSNIRDGVVTLRVWRRDPAYDALWDRVTSKIGRRGNRRWNTYFVPPVDDVLERLILNYDTDAAANEIREAFEFVATQRAERRKEIEEIVRSELE